MKSWFSTSLNLLSLCETDRPDLELFITATRADLGPRFARTPWPSRWVSDAHASLRDTTVRAERGATPTASDAAPRSTRADFAILLLSPPPTSVSSLFARRGR